MSVDNNAVIPCDVLRGVINSFVLSDRGHWFKELHFVFLSI